MKKSCLASLLIAFTLVLAACDDTHKDEAYGGPTDGTLPNNGDTVALADSGIAPTRGDFDPTKDVNYDTLAAQTVYFAFDSSTVQASERGKLEQVRQWLIANPGHSLFLAGNADKRGTEEYNRALGERRALAVREYLVGLGVRADALYTNSYGSDRPAMQGDTEDAFAKNRRVEVGVVMKK